MDARPSGDDIDRIERALGWRPTAFRRAAPGRGDTATNQRWIGSDDRRSAFVKIGATELTARWIRDEYENYQAIQGWFMPRVLGVDDDGERPVLAIEDLSACAWPPPWTPDRVQGVLAVLAAIRSTPPPDRARGQVLDWGTNWPEIAAAPGELLALGLCSPRWLDANLPALLDAAAAARLGGDALIHMDIRSDNLCFREGRAVVIDWNHAAIANPDLEVAAWLPSLQAEGGPAPETILPDAPELAAWLAGFFGSRAGGPPIPEAPHVRPLQVAQLRTALPWAARALGLEPPA